MFWFYYYFVVFFWKVYEIKFKSFIEVNCLNYVVWCCYKKRIKIYFFFKYLYKYFLLVYFVFNIEVDLVGF